MTRWTRRDLGKLAGSAALAGIVAPAIAAASARVVVVGGGPAGATVARYLAHAPSRLKVTLVEAEVRYHTCFFSNLYLGGLRSLDSLGHGYETLQAKHGVEVVHDAVTAIEPAPKQVRQAVMGTLPPELTASGVIRLGGADLLASSPDERRARWGRAISLLPQEPWLALDPTMRIGPQVAEVHRFVRHEPASRSDALARNNLEEVELGDAGTLYPFQMSGGMCQRVVIAIAHAGSSGVLIADEPTKGLDADLRDNVVARLRREVEAGRLLFTITHDVGVARVLGGTVGIMLNGELVDYGPAQQVLTSPSHPYSRALLDADPATWPPRAPTPSGQMVLAARGLAKAFGDRPLFKDLDIEVRAGEIVAIVGPSGCGKTTVGNILLGLVMSDAGTIEWRKGISSLRFQKLYQDPPAAFPPHQTIRKGLQDLVTLHRRGWSDVTKLLERLRLQDDLLDRLPSQISGGELQRFAILRALLLDPAFLFADECTSRLDPVGQKEVIDLLLEIVRDTGLGLLLVTHDRVLAERVATTTIQLSATRAGI